MINTMRKWILFLPLLGAALVIMLLAAQRETAVQAAAPIDTTNTTVANCRYGVTPLETDVDWTQVQYVSRLGAGWYMSFTHREPDIPVANNAEFAHIIHTYQTKAADGSYLQGYRTRPALNATLATYIRNHPGRLWIVGNEIDRGPAPGYSVGGQGDMFPDMYAVAYHDVYHFIKRHDPTARVANSALVQVTPGRLQYLDLMWNAYRARYGSPMPVDVWTMHLYVLPEVEQDGITPNNIANVALGTDPRLGKRVSNLTPQDCPNPDVYCFAEHDDMNIFAEQVVGMRQWMQRHGQQNKPLIITEYSILYPFLDYDDPVNPTQCFLMDEYGNCFTPQRVSTFMLNTFNYLNNAQDPNLGYPLDSNRLVQQWMWFAVYTTAEGSASNLAEADLVTLTQVGRTFQNHVFDETPIFNLVVDRVSNPVVFTNETGRARAQLRVTFRNNGNANINTPFEVTFYANPQRTRVIGTATVDALVRGCATNVYTAVVPWAELEPGVHRFWVYVDSNYDIPEGLGGESDNLGQGIVLVDPDQAYLPLVKRP